MSTDATLPDATFHTDARADTAPDVTVSPYEHAVDALEWYETAATEEIDGDLAPAFRQQIALAREHLERAARVATMRPAA